MIVPGILSGYGFAVPYMHAHAGDGDRWCPCCGGEEKTSSSRRALCAVRLCRITHTTEIKHSLVAVNRMQHPAFAYAML